MEHQEGRAKSGGSSERGEQQEQPKIQDQINIVAASHFNFNYILGSVLWLSFFLPLSSRYFIENAYGLPYIGVNSLCLYAGLGTFFLFSWITYWCIWRKSEDQDASVCFNNYKRGINISLFFALIGATVKLFSFINYKNSGIFLVYSIGHVILVVGVVIYFIVTILHLKYTTKQAFALNDTFATVATGLVIAMVIVHSVYADSDKFFTKVQRVQIKNFVIMAVNWMAILALLIYHLVCGEAIIKA